MKIIVNFLNGSGYWQDIVNASAAEASRILSDPALIAQAAAFPKFDFTVQTPEQVAFNLANQTEVVIKVGFYSKWLTLAIAYEENGAVYFNTWKQKHGAGSPGNLAHETMHALGYEHDGNSPEGNQNTVPWWVGNQVDARAWKA